MSWRDVPDRPYDPHGGRNAFRSNDTTTTNVSLRAMRSFTESIECDVPPVPELPPSLDIDNISMKTSDTNDTIIEVLKQPLESEPTTTTTGNVDPSLGETQKYKMAVPGPGHSEQEHELHKSLLREDEDELDGEIEAAMSAAASTKPKRDGARERDEEHAAMRREYNNMTTSRPRPTTPTSSCVVESLAFVGGSEEMTIDKDKKIVVSIPEKNSLQRKRSDMTYSDFYDNMSSQIPRQVRRSMSGRTTPLNDYDGDILEENPEFKNKAPPPPVVHRRTSIDWENFEDHKDELLPRDNSSKDAISTSTANAPTAGAPAAAAVPFNASNQDEMDEEEPSFSEDMLEQRKKLSTTAKEPSEAGTEGPEKTAEPEPKPSESVVPAKSGFGDDDFSKHPAPEITKTTEVQQQESARNVEAEPAPAPATVDTNGTEEHPVEAAPSEGQEGQAYEGEQTYDPNAYPGYIWNYDTQQWDVDPNYHADYSGGYYEGQDGQQPATTVDGQYSYDQYYDYTQQGYSEGAADPSQAQAYDYTAKQYDQNYVFDQSQFSQDTSQYGQEGSQYGQEGSQYGHEGSQYGAEGFQYGQEGSQYGQGDYPTDPYYQQTASTAGYDQQQQQGYDEYYQYDQAAYQQNYDGTYSYEQTVSEQYVHTDPDGHQQGYGESARYYGTAAHDAQFAYESNGAAAIDQDQSMAAQPLSTTALPSQYAQPLFNSAPVSDPYAWNDQQTTSAEATISPPTAASSVSPVAVKTSSAVAAPPPRPEPARPPPPSRPAPPAPSTAQTHAPPPPRPPPAHVPAPAAAEPPPGSLPPARPLVPPAPKKQEAAPEEDAWSQFKKMTEKVSAAVKTTEEQLKTLADTTAALDIKDESYLASIGGNQGTVPDSVQREIARLNEEKNNAKLVKKKMKQQGKKAASPEFDPDQEAEMDRKAQELAAKMAAMSGMGPIAPPKPPLSEAARSTPITMIESPAPSNNRAAEVKEDVERKDSLSAIPPRKRSSLKDVQQDSGGSLELPPHLCTQQRDSITPQGDLDPDDPKLTAPAWTDFDTTAPILPPSESGFFSSKDNGATAEASASSSDPFAPTKDAFSSAAADVNLIDNSYDPFAVKTVDEIVAAAKAKAEEALKKDDTDDIDFYNNDRHSDLSTPTPVGGSPVSHGRPMGFDDEFKCAGGDLETPTPLYDEDDSQPLDEFMAPFAGDGWELMLRHPIKKKSFMAERCWKPCYVRLHGTTLLVYSSKTDNKPIQELLLQATYSLSDTTLQAYDVYGKIHTVKLQYVQYKERVGIRPGQITRLVDGHVTKYGLPLEHSAQCNVLLKFGSLDANELRSFVYTIEDLLFKCPAKRTTKPLYKQDEVQMHCYDEYTASVDKDGVLSDQRARVRLYCLAFLSGSPVLEIGLNDRRRQGKEIVRRKDILPMYTERWIRFENLEFHDIVDKPAFEKEHVIRLSPPDGTFFEVMRWRVRPPRNREKALTVKAIMKIAGSKVEIKIDAMAAAAIQKDRGGRSTRRQIPCEDIAIRFPIPEAWIYIFREERHWGVGSVHSKKLRPGKVKNLKDRLLGAVQSNEPNLIECAIGEAKYEHVFRSLVWRIPRLPEKHHAAYKSHLLKCRFELSSFDLMPETFLPRCEVEFTMPLATVSNAVIRSVSVEQHEDSDRVEKFVRYVAKCTHKVEIDYVQCADLDIDANDLKAMDDTTTVPDMHQPMFQPGAVDENHDGYRIEFNEAEMGASKKDDSSSDEDDEKERKFPMIQIDMKNYGY